MALALSVCAFGCAGVAVRSDPLPSWNDGPARRSILDLVDAATDESSPEYVPPGDRIATFDNDGTLWVSHPIYAQAAFALDRVRALAPEHPEWKSEQPFRAVLEDDQAEKQGWVVISIKKDWKQVFSWE